MKHQHQKLFKFDSRRDTNTNLGFVFEKIVEVYLLFELRISIWHDKT